jgi:hypothetical protein
MSESLALPGPVVPPSEAERLACERMASISTEGCEEKAKAAKLKATLLFDKSEPTEVPEFVRRQNAAEQSSIQSEIARLQQKPEAV